MEQGAHRQLRQITELYTQKKEGAQLLFSESVPAYSEILRNDNLCVSEFAPRGWGERVYLFLSDNETQRMVGFLDFAPPPLAVGGSSPQRREDYLLIEASLAWPSEFREKGWMRLSCDSTSYQMLGCEEFECVPWVIPRPGFTNWCAQAATHTALDICRSAPFNARPLGVFDISRIGRQRSADESAHLGTGLGGEGLTPQGVMRAMSSGWCRLEALCKGLPFTLTEERELPWAMRVAYLRGLIRSGIPAVLCLNWSSWRGKVREDVCPNEDKRQELLKKNGASTAGRHAVVLTGYKGEQEASKDDLFVVCDPTLGPFVTVRAEDLLRAMANFRAGKSERHHFCRLNFVMPTPVGVCQDLNSVYKVVENLVNQLRCETKLHGKIDALAGIDTPIAQSVDWNPAHLIYNLEHTRGFVSGRIYNKLRLGLRKVPEEVPEAWGEVLQFAQRILDGTGIRYLWTVLIPVSEEGREKGQMPVLIAVPATVSSSEAPGVVLALAFERQTEGSSS